jgi:hypothetical protein
MSDIFREVDEEVRRSRAEALWARYGWLLIGLCAIIVIGVGGYRYYQHTREVAAAAAGARFESALNDFARGRGADAEKTLQELAAKPDNAYASLARMRLATELAKRNAAEGMASFDGIARDQSLDQTLRDIATLRAGQIAVDSLPLAEVERRLQPLTANNGAFRHQAHELIAMAAIKANDLEKARRNLDTIIIDRQAPSDVRGRAEILIGVTRGAT